MCTLIRSQKQICKPPTKENIVSAGLQELRKNALRQKSKELRQQEEAKGGKDDQKPRKHRGLFSLVREVLKSIGNLLLNSKFSIDELINIVRPVIYVYCVMRFGRRSFKPIKISLVLDVVQAFFSMLRLRRSHKERKRMNQESVGNSLHKRPQATQSALFRGPLTSGLPEIDLASAQIPFRKMHFALRNVEMFELQRRIF